MAKELTNKKKKEWAYSEFMNSDLSQVEIAAKVGSSKQTINRWATEGKWKELKESLSTTRESQLKEFSGQLDALNKEIKKRDQKYPSSKEMDILIKLTKAIDIFKGESSTADRISHNRSLISFLRKNFPDKVKEWTPILDLFVKDSL